MTTLKDRVVFITGAASGIGAATAVACREAGAIVVGADVAEVPLVDMAIKLDVSSAAETQNAVASIIDRFGRIDGVVTCAGISVPGSIEQFDLVAFVVTAERGKS